MKRNISSIKNIKAKTNGYTEYEVTIIAYGSEAIQCNKSELKIIEKVQSRAMFGAVQQCRSTTVPKMKTLFNSVEMKTLFNSAKNFNKFQHIKCGNQKLNSDRLQSLI